MCILFVHTLLKVVSHYDFKVLSMLDIAFQKSLDTAVSSIQIVFWFSDFFKLCKPNYYNLVDI